MPDPWGSFRIFRKLLQLSQVFAFFANWAETVPLGASACSRLPSSFSVPLRWHPPLVGAAFSPPATGKTPAYAMGAEGRCEVRSCGACNIGEIGRRSWWRMRFEGAATPRAPRPENRCRRTWLRGTSQRPVRSSDARGETVDREFPHAMREKHRERRTHSRGLWRFCGRLFFWGQQEFV